MLYNHEPYQSTVTKGVIVPEDLAAAKLRFQGVATWGWANETTITNMAGFADKMRDYHTVFSILTTEEQHDLKQPIMRALHDSYLFAILKQPPGDLELDFMINRTPAGVYCTIIGKRSGQKVISAESFVSI